MGLDLNTALISDTFDGLIKTTDGNTLTGSPLVLTDGRGNDSSLALATAGNGVIITGTLTVGGVNLSTGLSQAQADIIAIETKTDFITVTGAVNLDTIKTKADFITVTQAVDLDTIESQAASASTKTAFITVTQAVNLDTMESDILSAKTKTDFITIGQAVNLDNVESGLATAEADIIAIEAKTDYITISSALNLNTVASNASAAKTKTDFLTVTQAVNLDTLESDVNVAKGDITAIEAKTDNITVTQAVNLDTMESDLASSKAKTDFITITQAVNLDTVESGLSQAQTDINNIEGKTNNITVTQAVNLDTMESDIATNNAKNSYPAGDATKVGFISVTQAVNLDSMETDISNLSTNKYDKTGGTISGSVTITNDLTVNGTTTTVNTQTLSVKDPLIELANDNAANSVDVGFFANYSLDAGVTTKYAGLFKDAGDSDKFKLFKGLEVEPTTTVDTAGTGYTKGDLVVNDLDAVTISGALTGNVSGNVTGNVTGDLTGNVTATSVLANGVIATTQSTSDNSTKVATTAYVKSVLTAEDLDIAGDTGTGSIDLDSQTLTIAGTANEIETSASGQTITIGLPSTITANVTGNVAGDLTGTVLTAAQTNITSVGTLSSLAVGGGITSTELTTITLTGTSGDITLTSTNRFRSPNGFGFQVDAGATPTSATTPTYTFRGDGDSGMFMPTTGNVAFSTGGSERMRITSSGNVGIGSSNPTISVGSGLVIDNTISTISLQNGTGSAEGFDFIKAGNDGYLILRDSGNMRFDVNGSERMRIDSSGRVGIGTSTPSNELTIESASGATRATLINTNNAAGGAGVFLSVKNGGTQVSNATLKTDNAGNFSIFTGTTSESERMRIDSSGNVGIGRSPVAYGSFRTLDVAGSSGAIQKWVHTGSSVEAQLYASSTLVAVGSVSNNDLVFTRQNAERARITANGLTFNGDTAAANALDDYEEGTWSPVVSDESGNNSPSYGTQSGTYTKIGDVVVCQFNLTNISNSGLVSGDAIRISLPFTSGTSYYGQLEVRTLTYSGDFLCCQSSAGNSYMFIVANASGVNSSGVLVSGLSGATTDIRGTISYKI